MGHCAKDASLGSVMDDFLEALATTSKGKPGFRCGVMRLLAELSDNHRRAVEHEIDLIVQARREGMTSRHSCESLARVLTDHGYRISGAVLQSHVGRRCACGR